MIWWSKAFERAAAICFGAGAAFAYTVCVYGIGRLATPAFFLILGCLFILFVDVLRNRARKRGMA